MLNDIVHLDSYRLMVYMPNYALRLDETKSVQCIIYIAGYNFYDFAFYEPVLSEGIAVIAGRREKLIYSMLYLGWGV